MKKLYLVVMVSAIMLPLRGMNDWSWGFDYKKFQEEKAMYHLEKLTKECEEFLKISSAKRKQERFLDAIKKGDKHLVEQFLKEGVDVSGRIYNGITPLGLSLKNKQHEISQLLIDHGADVNVYDVPEYSPLHIAIKNEDLVAVKLLLNHPKIDLSVGKKGEELFVYAFKKKEDCFHGTSYEILKLLLSHAKFNIRQIDEEEGSVFSRLSCSLGYEYYGKRAGYKERMSNGVEIITLSLKKMLKPYSDRRRVAEQLFIGRTDKNSSLYRLPNDMICRILSYVPYSKKNGVNDLRKMLELKSNSFRKETALQGMLGWLKHAQPNHELKMKGKILFINQVKELLNPNNAEKTYEAITKYKHASVRKVIVKNQFPQKPVVVSVSNKPSSAPSNKNKPHGGVVPDQKIKSLPRYMQTTQSQLSRQQQKNKQDVQEKK